MSGLEAKAFTIGLNAVIWGFPMVFFEDVMRERTRDDALEVTGKPQSQVNQLALVRNLRGPEFKAIATPNNDTLYTQGFMDVSREPLVLSVPAVDADRYYVFQQWDVNGDTFSYVGPRTTGRAAGDYAFVGPDWQGDLPDGVQRIDSAYNSFAIWGRIGVQSPEDVINANAIQDAVRLTPLSLFGTSEDQVPPDMAYSQERVAWSRPDDVPEQLEFYAKLARALVHTPPKPGQDDVIADSLQSIGFTDENTRFDPSTLSESEQRGLEKAFQFGLHVMDVSAQTAGTAVNGWRWSPQAGVMGTDYLFRAAWAKWFTGGNGAEEAIYMDGRADDTGTPFDGAKAYEMRFEPGQQPNMGAFWSLSMYHLSDGSFVENSINRYALGNRTQDIVTADNGSLTIYIQHEAPEDPVKRANWLPAPKEGFYMNLRMYYPDDGLKNGTWSPPQVVVMDGG